LSLSALLQYQHRLSVVVAAYCHSTSLVVLRKGKGLPPLRSQGSPLRSDPFGTITLDFFHPASIQAIIGLSPKALLLIFLFLNTSHTEAWRLRNLPLLFLLGWRTFPLSWRSGFCQALRGCLKSRYDRRENSEGSAMEKEEKRYPSDLTEAEWAILEPLIPRPKPGGHPRTVNIGKW
jgi:hypothetical protein